MNDELIYSSRYGEGAALKLNLRSNMLRRLSNLAAVYNYMPEVSDDLPIYQPGPLDESAQRALTDEGQVRSVDEPGFLGSAYDKVSGFLFGDSDYTMADRFREGSLIDGYRLFQEKRLQAELGAKESELADIKEGIGQIEEAEQYAKMLDTLRLLRVQATNAYNNGDFETALLLEESFKEVLDGINQFQEKIKTTGKQSDVFLNLFFDPDKASARENALATTLNLTVDRRIEDKWTPWGLVGSATEQAASIFANWFLSGADAINKLIYPNATYGNFTRRAIKNTFPDERWTDGLFEGYLGDYINGLKNTQDLRNKISELKNRYQEAFDQKDWEVRNITNKYKNGAWYFDPQKINPKFREISENNDSGILGSIFDISLWPYVFAEMGSSYSDYVNMGAMMGTDAGLNYAIRKLSTAAMRRSPITVALSVLAEYDELRTAGKFAEAARMAKRVEEALNTINATKRAVELGRFSAGGAEQLANLYFINQMRQHETGAEVMDAWSSRVLDRSMKGGADMQKVIDSSRSYLENMGIDTSNMTNLDFVQHALAYDIQTGDEEFERQKKEGRAGLNKVYNDNMALAFKDYIEVLPFMSYSKLWLRSVFTKRGTSYAVTSNAERYAKAWYDGLIDRIASSSSKISKFFAKTPAQYLQYKHSLDYLKKLAKARAYIATMEGIEEGQLELLQSRYNRGEYDTYDNPRDLLSILSLLYDTELAWDAVLGYFGLNFGDPDNGSRQIRRAMLIGAGAGFWMGSMGAITNMLPSTGEDNIRNLIAQFKNDRVIAAIMGESQGKAQDDAEIGMYYEAFKRKGVNTTRMTESLLQLKGLKGELVSDDFIDNSIDLLNETYRQYNNPSEYVKKIMEEEGIEKNSEKHKNLVRLAVRYNIDARRGLERVKAYQHEQDQYVDSLMRRIYWPNYISLSEEDKKLYQKIKQLYEQYLSDRKKQRKDLKETLNKRNPEDFKQVVKDAKGKVIESRYMNPAEINQEIDKRLLDFDDDFVDRETFFRNTLNNMVVARNITNYETLIELFKDINALSEAVNKELGLDIQTNKQQAMILAMESMLKKLSAQLDPRISAFNEIVEIFNKTKKSKKGKIPTKDLINKRIYDLYGTLPEMDQLDKIQQRLILNRAVYDTTAPLANALYNGLVNPIGLSLLLDNNKWSSLSDQEKAEFAKSINDERESKGLSPLITPSIAQIYNQLLKKKLSKILEDEKNMQDHIKNHTDEDDTLEGDVDAYVIMLDAAKHLIQYELAEKQERKRIAHREFLRDQVTEEQVREMADNGDKEAKSILDSGGSSIEDDQDDNVGVSEEDIENTSGFTVPDADTERGVLADEQSGEGGLTDGEETGEDGLLEDDEEGLDELSEDEEYLANKFGLKPIFGRRRKTSKGKKKKRHEPDKEDDEEFDEQSEEGEGSNEGLPDEEPVEAGFTEDEQPDEDGGLSVDDYFTEYLESSEDEGSDKDPFLEGDELSVQSSEQVEGDYLSQTFFFDDTAEQGEIEHGLFGIKINGIPVKFKNDGELRSGKELGLRLLEPGFFENADKYFVISGNLTNRDKTNPDNLVVSLIIQDGKKVYATFLRGLDKTIENGKPIDKEAELRQKLLDLFDRREFKVYGTTEERKAARIRRAEIYNDAKQSIFLRYYSTKELDKIRNWTPNTELQRAIDLLARIKRSKAGKVFTDEHIDEMINNLRKTRNQIIEQCVEKDPNGNYVLLTEGYRIVTPSNPRISNGAFNNTKTDDGVPVYRKLTEAPFGLDEDLEKMSEQIQSEEVKIGVGRGIRVDEGSEYLIDKLDPAAGESYNRSTDKKTGRSGKLYVVVETANGGQSYVQLHEAKFDQQGDAKIEQLSDIEEAFDEFGVLIPGKKASTAEIVMRLVTNSVSRKNFSHLDIDNYSLFIDALIDFVVHFDQSTYLKEQYSADQLNKELARKLFFELDGKLFLPLNDNFTKIPKRGVSIDNILVTESVRRNVIYSIAKNFHWNTERENMIRKIDFRILDPIRKFFINNPDLTELKLFDNDLFAFRKSDLFNEDMTPKEVTHIAWMISNQLLETDISPESIYRAPFVYADGAIETTPQEKIIDEGVAIGDKKRKEEGGSVSASRITATNEVQLEVSQESVLNVSDRIGADILDLDIDELIERRKSNVDKYYSSNGISDVGLLDVEAKGLSAQQILDNINKSVDKYKAWFKKNFNIDLNVSVLINNSEADNLKTGNYIPVITAYLNGTATVVSLNVDTLLLWLQLDTNAISGVYSDVKSDGSLDKDAARKWIKQTLGLDDSSIIITDGILRGMDGKEVYGVTRLTINKLSRSIGGQFMLSSRAGRGIHYHEAFHYVNLLLHSPKKRRQIYESYVKLHPEDSKERKRVIEEHMAEDFRMYAEDIESRTGFKGWLKNIFDSIIRFVRFWDSNKKAIDRLYRDILRGRYKGGALDAESVRQFKKRYKRGVYSDFRIPNVDQQAVNNFEYITSPDIFFSVAQSLANLFVVDSGLRSYSGRIRFNKEMFDDFFIKLKTAYKDNGYVKDVVNNPKPFVDAINMILKQYGVTSKDTTTKKYKRVNDKQTDSENKLNNTESGEREENSWDKFLYEVDPSESVAFRAKLFLCSILKSRFKYNEKKKKNVLVAELNKYTGMLEYVPFKDAWIQIVRNLHNVEGYLDLLNEVQRLGETDWFFAQLYRNLQRVAKDDVELQNLIFNTVNLHNPQISFEEVSDPKKKKFTSEDEDDDIDDQDDDFDLDDNAPVRKSSNPSFSETQDQYRNITIKNDNTLKAKRMLPREWSKSLFSSALIEYDGEKYVINSEYLSKLRKDLSTILKLMDNDKEFKELKNKHEDGVLEQRMQEVYDAVFPLLLLLIKDISIPFDEDTLTSYINKHISTSKGFGDITDRYKALKQILGRPDYKNANLQYFITSLFKPGASDLKSGKVTRTLQDVYANFKGTSEISLMASAYNDVHPSSREFTLTGPNGNMIYPMNQNNYISDVIRWLNSNYNDILESFDVTSYTKHSKLAEIAKRIQSEEFRNDYELKLNLDVGMLDSNFHEGRDYFEVSPLEDTVKKMIMLDNNMFVLPTMADKKTYYFIELISRLSGKTTKVWQMPHDILSFEWESVDHKKQSFSQDTLNIFAGYFLDELSALENYYDKENIAQLVKDPNKLKVNFHGKVKNGRMDFSGNGGKFRYFAGIGMKQYQYIEDGSVKQVILDLNEQLEHLYNLQKSIEDGNSSEGISQLREDSEKLDGFELVRKKLREIRDTYILNNGMVKDVLYTDINRVLWNHTLDQLTLFSDPKSTKRLLNRDELGVTWARSIPVQLLKEYTDLFTKKGRSMGKAEGGYYLSDKSRDVALSVVGNFVVQSAISTIEVEKIVTGDPAFYKWKGAIKRKVVIDGFETEVTRYKDKHSDKIKRLGAVLSPGSEIRTDYTDEQLRMYPWLKGTKYTNLNIGDINARSTFYNIVSDIFKKQLIADKIRSVSTIIDTPKEVIDIWGGRGKINEFFSNTYELAPNIYDLFRLLPDTQENYEEIKSIEVAIKNAGLYNDNRLLGASVENIMLAFKVFYADESYVVRDKKGKLINLTETGKLLFKSILTDNPFEAKRRGKDRNEIKNLSKKWDDVSYDIMKVAIRARFAGIKPARKRLIDTKDAVFAHTKAHDKYRTLFPKALTEIRDEISDYKPIPEEQAGRYKDINIDDIYYKDGYSDEIYNQMTEEEKSQIDAVLNSQLKPYRGINVSDAQVLIRPQLYRKIRMGLGQWSTESITIKYKDSLGRVKETTYSDDEAYEILEKDASWMSDPEKAAKVSRLLLFPLKMTYFKNDPIAFSEFDVVRMPTYNKMAIFPVFKSLFMSTTGKLIYDRMNREHNELDMISFESAVKVGLNKNIYSPFEDGTESLSKLSQELQKDSNVYLEGDVENTRDDSNLLNVRVLDLRGLRMQLNTEAHTDAERSIGTLMFKIMFSNILDKEIYTTASGEKKTGAQIRKDIMNYIKVLTAKGARDLKKRFYNGEGTLLDDKKILKFINHIIDNNELGANAAEIIANGGVIESLMSRTIFENSVSALVNSDVIDINTKGGSAILQSVFGFVSYNSDYVIDEDDILEGFPVLNNGKELKWYKKDGSMEVLLSMNFFKAVVPRKYQTDYKTMRQWLINNDIIKGTKKRIQLKGEFDVEKLDKSLVEYQIKYTPWRDDEKKTKKVLNIYLKGLKEKGYFQLVADTDFENTKFNGEYSVHFKTNNGKFGDEKTQPSTKEERAVLFEQLLNAIPEGARVSTYGSLSPGGIYKIDQIGQDSRFVKDGLRVVSKKEDGSKIRIPVYKKLYTDDDIYFDYSEKDKYLTGIANTKLTNLNFSVRALKQLQDNHFETLADVVTETEDRLRFRGLDKKTISEIKDSMEDLDLTFGMQLPKKRAVKSNPKPFGVGYRIPTQGLSSTFAFTVADVIPSLFGDVIVVPREFTAQTGSDFDVDKLFLATFSYEKGKLETIKDKDLFNSTKGAIGNQLLQNYVDVVSNIKNFANARASIDVITSEIQDDILPIIRGRSGYSGSMYELMPYFQARTKEEFKTGKDGIGPFALNITNLALTQFSHLTMDFTGLEDFNFGDLDEIVGQDGKRISDWLSAMVNAHVDVAKDPYIFDLNINSATYPLTNFLLRAGKGKSTFFFLAQPILVEWASKKNSGKSIYGSNLNITYEDADEKEGKDDKYISLEDKLIRSYKNKLDKAIKTALLTDKEKSEWLKRSERALSSKGMDFTDIFQIGLGRGQSLAEKALQNKDSLESLWFQIKTMHALKKILPYARELSELVSYSRIDTKKFGNNLATHHNFINGYLHFKYGQHEINWACTDDYKGNPLQRYFDDTFLEDKLFTATQMTRDILKRHTFTASDVFQDTMDVIYQLIFGEENPVTTNTGSDHNIYTPTKNEDIVKSIWNAVENVFRIKALMFYGNSAYNQISSMPFDSSLAFDYYEFEKQRDYSGPLNLTFGGDLQELKKQIKRLFFGDKDSQSTYYKRDLFLNISRCINAAQTASIEDKKEKWSGIVDENGIVINDLLNYLKPLPATETDPVPRLLLARNNRNTPTVEKQKLTASWDLMFRHKNKMIRMLARDIALYAYYSTYDTNTVNSFFELVPPEYRAQYDISLQTAVKQQDGVAALILGFDENFNPGDLLNCANLLRFVCKNYYIDDDIVPKYQLQNELSIMSKDVKSGEWTGISKVPVKIGNKYEYVPPVIISSKIRTTDGRISPPYIKLQKGDSYILYEKYFMFKQQNNKDKKQIGPTWYGYRLVLKLGLHSGTTHIFEFVNSENDGSIFEQNDISDFYDDDVMKDNFRHFFTTAKKSIGPDSTLVVTNYLKGLNVTKQEHDSRFRTIDEKIQQGFDSISSEQPEQYCAEHSDYIIDDRFEVTVNEILSLISDEEKDSFSLFINENTEIASVDELSILDNFQHSQHNAFVYRNERASEDNIALYDDKLKLLIEQNKEYIVSLEKAFRILTELEDSNFSITDLYVTDGMLGKAIYKIYKEGYDFANNIYIVGKERLNVDDIFYDGYIVLSDEEEKALTTIKGAIDKINDSFYSTEIDVQLAMLNADNTIQEVISKHPQLINRESRKLLNRLLEIAGGLLKSATQEAEESDERFDKNCN